MNSKNRTVTNGKWNFGGLYGSGIKTIDGKPGYVIQPFRIIRKEDLEKFGIKTEKKCLIMHGQIYGKTCTVEESDKLSKELGLLYGYTKRYSRNTCKFVMSRAARKRGHKTSDRIYNDNAKRNGR